jgi:hypothetical protein
MPILVQQQLVLLLGQPAAIAVTSSTKTDASCNGGTNGTITLGAVSGGTPTYTSWTETGRYNTASTAIY